MFCVTQTLSFSLSHLKTTIACLFYKDSTCRPSVWNLVRLVLPLNESLQRLGMQQLLHRNFPFPNRQGNFAIYKIVVERYLRGIGSCVPVKDFSEAGPINSREAHGAGLATGVEVAVVQLEGLEPFA